jgi:alpha-ketoglutarate-dependent taurine dioxygenase
MSESISTALGKDVVLTLDPEGFPAFVTPASPRLAQDLDAFTEWLVAHEDEIDELLLTHAALRFRGFPLHTTEDFASTLAHLPSADMGYTGGGTPRSAVAGKVFESTRTAKEIHLPLHQEMSYLPHWPLKLAFFSRVAAASGGATDIADVRRFEAHAPARVLDEVKRRGVLYLRNFRDGQRPTQDWNPRVASMHRPWQHAFGTEDPAQAQAACEVMGLDWEWLGDGSLQTCYRASGYVMHPVLGTEHWFNQISSLTFLPGSPHWDAYWQHFGESKPQPYVVRYGDGSPIATQDVADLRQILFDVAVAQPWQPGEFLLLDNILCLHGRSPFEGERDTQVQLFGVGSQ